MRVKDSAALANAGRPKEIGPGEQIAGSMLTHNQRLAVSVVLVIDVDRALAAMTAALLSFLFRLRIPIRAPTFPDRRSRLGCDRCDVAQFIIRCCSIHHKPGSVCQLLIPRSSSSAKLPNSSKNASGVLSSRSFSEPCSRPLRLR